jgi:hypothetical protein
MELQLRQNHQRPHHVVLFVFQDVAMPHVLVAASPRTRWQANGTCGNLNCAFTRVTSYGFMRTDFLPAAIVRVWWRERTVRHSDVGERRRAQHLHIRQVEMHRMCVTRYGRNYMDAPTEVYHNGQIVVWDVYNTIGPPSEFHGTWPPCK